MGVLRRNKKASTASEIGRLRPDDVVGPKRASKDDEGKSENRGKSAGTNSAATKTAAGSKSGSRKKTKARS